MNTISFEGTLSGDGECFCWRVDLDTYKEFDRHWEDEIKYLQEFNIEQGYPKDHGMSGLFAMYPDKVHNKLDMVAGKKYKITMTAEEIE